MPPFDLTAGVTVQGRDFSRLADLVGNGLSLAHELEAASGLESAWQSQETAFRVEDPLADLFQRISTNLRQEAEFNAEREAQATYFAQLAETVPSYDDSARLAIATQHGLVAQSSNITTIWGDVHTYFQQTRLEQDRWVEADRARGFAIQVADHYAAIAAEQAAVAQAAAISRGFNRVAGDYFNDPRFEGATEEAIEYMREVANGTSTDENNRTIRGLLGIGEKHANTPYARGVEAAWERYDALMNQWIGEGSPFTETQKGLINEIYHRDGGHLSPSMLIFLEEAAERDPPYTDDEFGAT